MAFIVLNAGNEPHYIWGTLKSGGRDVAVSIFLTTIEASDGSPLKDRVGMFVETVEPKDMETAQVTTDVAAMQRGLAAEGRIALYGVYFDTGKADVKPESKAQLDEMAKLLEADRTMKVVIVGHTDNQGAIDRQRRAVAAPRRGGRYGAGPRLPDRCEAADREGRRQLRAGRVEPGRGRPREEPARGAGAAVARRVARASPCGTRGREGRAAAEDHDACPAANTDFAATGINCGPGAYAMNDVTP